MRHTVAISDIHLCEQEPGEGFWMHWRRAAYAPDRDIAEMLDALRREVRGDALELVLNGDVFDFDAPRFIQGKSLYHDFPRDAVHDAPALEAILDHHPVFVEALGRVLADGHTVVVVSGNHDAQLTIPAIREVLRRRVVAAALAQDPARGGLDPAALAARVVFRAWFHRTPDGVILEHGNQYDTYCSYRYPMAPWGKQPEVVQPTLGSLAFRFMIARMGYFNPHVDETFLLTPWGYVTHWARYWLFSRRSLLATWAAGAARTLMKLVRSRDRGARARLRACLLAAARETGAPLLAVAGHARLFAPPVEDRPGLIARQLWLDRAALIVAAAAAAGVWIRYAPRSLAPAAALTPALVVAYERSSPRPPLGASWRGVRGAARAIARAHRARAVIFGHTHAPEGTWEDGVFYGNTGSWSAAFADEACTRPLRSERPLIWLRAEGGRLDGGLVFWKAGRFEEPTRGAAPTPSPAAPPAPARRS